MSQTQWVKHFKDGRISVGEDPSPGRPSTSKNDDNVERVRAVIRGNRRLTDREFADEVGIGIGFYHYIFTEKLLMSRFSAKFVPRFFGLTIRKRTVLKTVTNCLPMQMAKKIF